MVIVLTYPSFFSVFSRPIHQSTINHQSSTINRQPSIINHQSSIINHQSSTIIAVIIAHHYRAKGKDQNTHYRRGAQWSSHARCKHEQHISLACKLPVIHRLVLTHHPVMMWLGFMRGNDLQIDRIINIFQLRVLNDSKATLLKTESNQQESQQQFQSNSFSNILMCKTLNFPARCLVPTAPFLANSFSNALTPLVLPL